MKTIILYSTVAFFFLGTSYAHEVAVSPTVTTHKVIVEHRIVQLNKRVGTLCSTNIMTTTIDGVKGATVKSVDCDE